MYRCHTLIFPSLFCRCCLITLPNETFTIWLPSQSLLPRKLNLNIRIEWMWLVFKYLIQVVFKSHIARAEMLDELNSSLETFLFSVHVENGFMCGWSFYFLVIPKAFISRAQPFDFSSCSLTKANSTLSNFSYQINLSADKCQILTSMLGTLKQDWMLLCSACGLADWGHER